MLIITAAPEKPVLDPSWQHVQDAIRAKLQPREFYFEELYLQPDNRYYAMYCDNTFIKKGVPQKAHWTEVTIDAELLKAFILSENLLAFTTHEGDCVYISLPEYLEYHLQEGVRKYIASDQPYLIEAE